MQDWPDNSQPRGTPCGPTSSHACKPPLMTPPAWQACGYWGSMSMCGTTRTDADKAHVNSPASRRSINASNAPRATQVLHSLTPTSASHNNIIIIYHASILSNKKTDTQTIEHASILWVLLPVTEIPRKPVVAHTRQNLSSSALILDPHTTSCEQIQLFIVA